jgi:methionine-rich copper-binding protein CopC
MSPPLFRRSTRATRARSLILFLALAMPMQAARAHGHLVKAAPAVDGHIASIPTLLRLSFSEAPTPAVSRITLFDAAMQPVSLGAIAADPKDGKTLSVAITGKMAPGRYTVRWKIAGDDGHPVNGTYAFTVDASPAASVAVGSVETPMFDASSPAYVAIRAVQFVSVVLLIGVLTLHVAVLPRLAKAGRGEAAYYAEARRRAEPWARGAMWAFGVATLARLAAQHVALFGSDARWGMETTGALLFQSLWGRVWIVALVGTAIGLWGVVRLVAGRTSG